MAFVFELRSVPLIPGMPLMSSFAGAGVLPLAAGELAGVMPGIDSISGAAGGEAVGVALGVGDIPGIGAISCCADVLLFAITNAPPMHKAASASLVMELLRFIILPQVTDTTRNIPTSM